MKFDWNPEKARANIIKHKVSFDEAKTVFDDKYAVTLFDEGHSEDEDRFVIIGESADYRELYVCHCYRGEHEDVVRILSARKATKTEIRIYYNERG